MAGPGLLVHVHPSDSCGFIGFLHLQAFDASHVVLPSVKARDTMGDRMDPRDVVGIRRDWAY